jgi:hypothetical protein
MEIIYIGVGIYLVWLVRTLHKIRCRDQEEADKKIAFAKWAKEQHDPRIVSMVQNFMSERCLSAASDSQRLMSVAGVAGLKALGLFNPEHE